MTQNKFENLHTSRKPLSSQLLITKEPLGLHFALTDFLEIISKFPNEYLSTISIILDLPQITRWCRIKVNLSI